MSEEQAALVPAACQLVASFIDAVLPGLVLAQTPPIFEAFINRWVLPFFIKAISKQLLTTPAGIFLEKA